MVERIRNFRTKSAKLDRAVRSQPIQRKGGPNGNGVSVSGSSMKDGTPADPPTLKAAVPDWRPGHTIHLGRNRSLRVIATRLVLVFDGSETPASSRATIHRFLRCRTHQPSILGRRTG